MGSMDGLVLNVEAKVLVRPLLMLGVGALVSVATWHLLMAEPWRGPIERARFDRVADGGPQAFELALQGTTLPE